MKSFGKQDLHVNFDPGVFRAFGDDFDVRHLARGSGFADSIASSR